MRVRHQTATTKVDSECPDKRSPGEKSDLNPRILSHRKDFTDVLHQDADGIRAIVNADDNDIPSWRSPTRAERNPGD